MQYIAVNQQVTLNNSDPVLNSFTNLLGLSLKMTEDELTKNAMESAASVYTCTAGNNGDIPSNLHVSDLDEVTATLMTNNAWMILDTIGGEDRFGTSPIRDAFVALGHTKLSKDINNLNNVVPKWNYPRDSKSVSSEWAACNNIRFFLSSVGSVDKHASALGNDVYNVFIQGMNAIGIIKQDNYSARLLYRPPVYSDPLFQNCTIGTTFAQVSTILHDLWLTKVRCTLR